MTESQKIKAEFVRLRSYGGIVFNYNSNRANNPGLKAHPDWLILTPKLNIVFVEVKLGKDSLSTDQLRVARRLSSVMALPQSRVHYFLCRDSSVAKQISDQILRGEL